MNETITTSRVSYYVFPGLELNGRRSLFQKDRHKTQVEEVVTIVCGYFQIEPASLLKKSRRYGDRRTADARKIVCYLCHEILHITLVEVAAVLGRHHTSAIFAIRQVNDLMVTNEVFAQDVYKLTQQLFN